MNKQTFIADTADVIMRRKSDGHVVFTAEAQLAGLTGGEESEVIRGGIGNKALYTVKHSKEVGLSVRNATFDLEFLSISQGARIDENGKLEVEVYKRNVEIEEGTGLGDNGVIKLDHNPTGDVTIVFSDGTSEIIGSDDINGKEVEVDESDIGKVVNVSYKREVEGRKITLDATKFAESYEVQYQTIEYDTESNVVTKDIYFVFPNATPTGEYEINFENGEAFTPELEFNVMTEANSNELGYIIEEERD